MYRFFCELNNITSQRITLTDKNEVHHLKDVLRLKINNKVSLIDGQGTELICSINQITKDKAQLEIIQKTHHKKEEFLPRITLACAIPKKSKIDFIVEKLAEIGIERIILLKTERTEVNPGDFSKKRERLEKITKESLKQSGNLFLPDILFMNFKELIEFKKENNFDVAFIPNLADNTQAIKDIFGKNQHKNILVAIGPEGDFSPDEIDLAKKEGFIPVRLTQSVLKVDTAAIVAVGFIKLYLKANISVSEYQLGEYQGIRKSDNLLSLNDF